MSSLSVKLKNKKIKLSRLAKVLNVTRPTLYRYIDLFEQGNHSQIPQIALTMLNQLNRDDQAISKGAILPVTGTPVTDLIQQPRLIKEQIINLVRGFDEPKDSASLFHLLEILRSTKTRSLLALVSKLATISGKNLPSGKLENEIEWLLDYILHKHGKTNVDEIIIK
jgi:hypothetical protein